MLPEIRSLIDDYLDGQLDEAGLATLGEQLRSQPHVRQYFLNYCQLHTDLYLRTRARQAGQHVLSPIDGVRPAARR